MIIGLVILGTVLILSGAVMAFITNEYKPLHIVAAMSVIAAILLIVSGVAKYAQDKSSSEKTSSIQDTGVRTNAVVTKLQNQNDSLLKQNNSLMSEVGTQGSKIDIQSQTIDSLRKENVQLANMLARLSIETYNKIIAKDSYCYLTIRMPLDKTFSRAVVSVHHVGAHTLRNVQIALINTDEEYGGTCTKEVTFKRGSLAEKYHGFTHPYITSIPVVPPGGNTIELPNIEVTHNDQKSFNIYFRADNGETWYQRIVLRRAGAYYSNEGPNILLSSFFYSDYYLDATQLYKIRERTGDERGKNPATLNARVEVLIKEGSTSEGFGPYDPKVENSMKWGHFPKLKDEANPFSDIHKLHWEGPKLDGTSNSGPMFFQQVITEYESQDQ